MATETVAALEEMRAANAARLDRTRARLEALYGRLPDDTLNPAAEYFDQTDLHAVQMAAAERGNQGAQEEAPDHEDHGRPGRPHLDGLAGDVQRVHAGDVPTDPAPEADKEC